MTTRNPPIRSPARAGASIPARAVRPAVPAPVPKPTAAPGGQTPAPDEAATTPAAFTWPAAETLHPLVAAMPREVEGSLEQVASYVKAHEPSPYQRVKALHDWLADRIAYDAEALADGRIPRQHASTVFSSKKGVCAGYANLFKAMAEVTGDEVVVVVGDARTDLDEVGGGGHAWNAAKIEGRWFLIDATWDAGSVSGRTFTKRYRTDYLFTPPEVFAIDHLPERDEWQLRGTPLTRGEFMRQPMLQASFFARGFRLEQPDRSQVTVSDALEIALDNPRDQFVLATFAVKGADRDQDLRCSVTPGRRITARCGFPNNAVYRVHLFANAERSGSYEQVATLEAVRR